MTRPFAISTVVFLAGICAASFFPGSLPGGRMTFIACAAALASAAVSVRWSKLFTAFILLFFFILGAARWEDAVYSGERRAGVIITGCGTDPCVYGTVLGCPELKRNVFSGYWEFPFKAAKILVDGREYPANIGVLVRCREDALPPNAGDKALVEGRLSFPKGVSNPYGFDHRAHLANIGIHALMRSGKGDRMLVIARGGSPAAHVGNFLYRIKDVCGKSFDKYLRGDTKAIIKPLILGTRSETSSGLNDLFIRTGTMHILAVSGLHITFVAATVLGIFSISGFPKKPSYLLTVFFVCAYAVFTGGQPSAMRAALMGSLMLAALASGRRTALIDTLALSAFVMVFLDPGQLFRPGFILSYAAVLSIIYVVPVTDAVFVAEAGKRPVYPFSRMAIYMAKSFSLSLGVWLGMMPVIAAYFRIVTPSAILANLIAVPLFYLVMLLGFVLMFTGPVSFLAPISLGISRTLDIMVIFYIAVLEKIASIPCAFMKVTSLRMPLFWAYYAALAGIIVLTAKKPHRKNPIVIFMIFAAVLFVWSEALIEPLKSPRVTFFDVGKADAALIETPGGDILVDAGSDKAGDGGAGRNVLEPYLLQNGKRKIDCVILSHAHEDHIGGLLYLVRTFETGTLIDCISSPEKGSGERSYADLAGEIKMKKTKVFKTKSGDKVRGPGGTELLVFNPSESRFGGENSDSMVFKLLTPSKRSLLFCGDATAESMREMLSFGAALKSDIIKIPHHGSGLGDMNAVAGFLDCVRPGYAVITAQDRSEVNSELLDILARLGVKVFITGETGAVIAEEGPGGWRVRGFRDDPQENPR